MKKPILKAISVVFVLIMIFGTLFSLPVAAAEETSVGLLYKKNGGEICITGFEGDAEEIVIPEQIDGSPVTEIGAEAFKGSLFKYISIPSSVKKIGKDAFLDCYAIKTVDITDISRWCEIEFANEYSNPAISVYAKLCIDGAPVKSLYIPDGTSKIGAFAFYGNTDIEKVFIPQSVKSIGEMAFRGAYKIKDVYCVSTGETWEKMTSKAPAFITDNADIWLISPKETATAGLKYMEENGKITITGYEGNLYKLEIPAEIEGKPVVRIDSYAFQGKDTLAEVIIPDTVTEIWPGAFSECKYLTKVNIPERVEIIHEGTFENCESFGNIDFPKSLKEISYYAFNGCQSLTKLQIPEGTEIVADHAFSDCYNLKEISLPSTLAQLAGTAFYNTAYYKDTDNWTGNALYIDDCLIKVSEDTEGVFSVNAGTKIIGDYAFYNCSNITEVTIPNTLISVGNYGFYGCSGISSIDIPQTVQYIGFNAFSECRGLKTINFGGNELQWNSAIGENNIGADRVTVNFGNENRYIQGDVNLDGRLNVRDATLIQKFMAKIESLEGKALELADFNADGKINVKDATAIQKHIAGMPY